MSDNICLPKTHMIIVFAIFMGLTVWYIHNDKKYHTDEPNYKYSDSIIDSINKKISELNNKIVVAEVKALTAEEKALTAQEKALTAEVKASNAEEKVSSANKQAQIVRKETIDVLSQELERRRFIQERDQKVLENDFIAPERRQPEHAYPVKQVKTLINIPTRGLPDNYHLIGLLLRNNTETAFKLFGRQKYPGSNQWEYFVQGVMSHNDVKIPINIRGDREIEDGQTVVVPGTDHSKGGFKVKLYNFDLPRYNPYDY